MDRHLREFLDRLHAEGREHDRAEPDRLRRRRNLEPDSAALLAMLVRAAGARTVLEIGTSNGVSTIWLADALRDTGGLLVSVDLDPAALDRARANLEQAGLSDRVELRAADGGTVLADLPDGALDVLFLDSERPEYPGWWRDVRRVLRPGGLLVVDNVLSHPDEVAEFLALADADPGVSGTVTPVGKGLFIAVTAP